MNYSCTSLLLRSDSGFETLDLYKQYETNGTFYVILLKENGTFRNYVEYADELLTEKTSLNQVDYAVEY